MAEKLVKVVAKLRQRGEKDQPPKLLCYIKWLKNVVSFFFFVFFCFENAKNLGWSDDAKRRKKREWRNRRKKCLFFYKKARLFTLSCFWQYADDAGITGVYFDRDYDLSFQWKFL